MCYVSQKDTDLKRRMENSTIIFQKTKLKKSGEKIIVVVDEESEQIIEDECELNLLFFPTINENLQNNNALKDHSQIEESVLLFDGLLSTVDEKSYQCSNFAQNMELDNSKDFTPEYQRFPSTSTSNQEDQVTETSSTIGTQKQHSTAKPEQLKNLSTVNLF